VYDDTPLEFTEDQMAEAHEWKFGTAIKDEDEEDSDEFVIGAEV
jgi:hypothetical protein